MSGAPVDSWQVPARKRIRMILEENRAVYDWRHARAIRGKAKGTPRPARLGAQEREAHAAPHRPDPRGKARAQEREARGKAKAQEEPPSRGMTRPRKVLMGGTWSAEVPSSSETPASPRKSLRVNTSSSHQAAGFAQMRNTKVPPTTPLSTATPPQDPSATPRLIHQDSLGWSDLRAVSSLSRVRAPPLTATPPRQSESPGRISNGSAAPELAYQCWEQTADDWYMTEDSRLQTSLLPTSEWVQPVLDLQMAFEAMLRGHHGLLQGQPPPPAPSPSPTPSAPALVSCSCGYQRLTFPGGPLPASDTTPGPGAAAPPCPPPLSPGSQRPTPPASPTTKGESPLTVKSDPGVSACREGKGDPVTDDCDGMTYVYCDLTSRETMRGIQAALGQGLGEAPEPTIIGPLIPSAAQLLPSIALRKAASAAEAGGGRWSEGKLKAAAEPPHPLRGPAVPLPEALLTPGETLANRPPEGPPHVAGDAEMSKLSQEKELKKLESIFLGPSGEIFAQEDCTESDTERQKLIPPGDATLHRLVQPTKSSDSATLAAKGLIFMAFFLFLPLLALGALIFQIRCDHVGPIDHLQSENLLSSLLNRSEL